MDFWSNFRCFCFFWIFDPPGNPNMLKMMPRGVGSISTPADFISAIFEISLFEASFTFSRPVCCFVQKVTFQKVKTVYKSQDLLYHQKMAYPRTDAQRPTYWKVFHYSSKRFHESRVIEFSVGETSKNEKIRVRQNRGSSCYFFKKRPCIL